MNQLTKLGLSLLLGSALATSCIAPLAFQDPASARQAPGFQTQRRFGSRPMMPTAQQRDAAFAPTGLQPQAAQQVASAQYPQDQAMPQSMAQPIARAAERLQPQATAPLMGWSGQVAAGSREGQTQLASGQPRHGLEPQIEGRMHILNLYQEVLDERDSLLVELQRLNTALQDGEQLLTQLRASEKEYGQRLASLEEIKRTLLEQNRDLSSRLTIAQIRRLESDKLLLETQITMYTSNQAPVLGDALDPMLVTDK